MQFQRYYFIVKQLLSVWVLFVEKKYFYCVEVEHVLRNAFDTYMLPVKTEFILGVYYTTYLSKQIASLFNQTSNGILSINTQ